MIGRKIIQKLKNYIYNVLMIIFLKIWLDFLHSDKITVRSDMDVFLFLILRYTE